MSEEKRQYQAADVYHATHDLELYEWVASLELFVTKLASEDWRGNKPQHVSDAQKLLRRKGATQ